ncbi:hypothetical protein CPHO_05130 [Corynebacterium phocae]|uniref:ABC transporter permease n=1 Tax=Corynebacterium phocae TaxID=161895 RepID=A0A1L7D2S9_9CORY|nr:ABC transporter permease [Corynebacterium phocae]APT92377.1 hypothetical protein CPHO_05130 [Corynebacterium phocae]
MHRLSWRTVLANKLRLSLTVLAVLLGTSFVAGSMMFTNSLGKIFDSAVEDVFVGVDVVMHSNRIAGASADLFSPGAGTSGVGGVDATIVQTLRADPHVSGVAVQGATAIVVADDERKPFQTGANISSIAPWYDAEQAVGPGNVIVEGAAPTGNGVVVNRKAAEIYEVAVGDTLVAVDPSSQQEYVVQGIYQPGASAADLSQGVLLLQAEGTYIDTYATGGYIPAVLIGGSDLKQQRLTAYLVHTYPQFGYSSAQKLAESFNENFSQALSFVNYFLVAFALIALLVGSFIIANTFAMIVAQRREEFGLLRAVGCSRTQLTVSVMIESILVAVVGSALGILGGMALVHIIQGALGALGMPIAVGTIGLNTKSVAFPLFLGIVVTVISAWAPARRAGAVKPVEAMRTTESSTQPSLKLRTLVGVAFIAVGSVAALWAALVSPEDLTTKPRAIGVGIAAFAIIGGVFMASPGFSIPVIGFLGKFVARPFGPMGRLAATNSRRNPKRTATTAFALTLGMALVTAIGMLSASMRDSIEDLVESEIVADFILQGPSTNGFPIPTNALTDVREDPLVDVAVAFSFAKVSLSPELEGLDSLRGFPVTFSADRDVSRVLKIQDPRGDFNLGQPNTFIARNSYAEKMGWKIGDTIPVYDLDGAEINTAKLIGTHGENRILKDFTLSTATIVGTPAYENDNLFRIVVVGNQEVAQEELRESLEQAVEKYLVVRVQNSSEYAGSVASLINQMLYILYALLALSVIVAVLGIVNTLALNVIERRQEIGMLRVVGTKRNQIRLLIIIESVQIALYGAIIGVIVGLGLGWAFLKVLGSQGLDVISVPYLVIALIMVGSGFVGVLAALWPAQKASRTPPLDAISS